MKNKSKPIPKSPAYAAAAVPRVNAAGLHICPGCHKATSPQFMWRFDDGTSLCLVCYHKTPETKQENHESHLASESKTAGYVWKTVGSLALFTVVVVVGICVFYKPHPTQVAKKDAAEAADLKALKKHGHKGGEGDSPDDADKDDKGDDGNKDPDDKSGDGKKSNSADTVGVTGKDGAKQHMAPTVQAVAATLPMKSGAAKDETKVPSGVVKLINQAQDLADALHPQGADGASGAAGQPAIKPTSKLKEEAAKTKDAALAVATAVIEKHDQDGTKTAELLGKLGQVSTTFADVATKLTDGITPTGKGGGAGGGGGSQRLEADVLASQGKSGYDPVEAVERELAAEEAGVAANSMVKVQGGPNAGQPAGAPGQSAAATFQAATQGNIAGSNSGSGIVQDQTALAMGSLPAAFVSAVSAGGSTGGGATDPARAGRLSVTVLSMKGDLLFDFNSAALRAEASAQLKEVAEVLARRPDLPVLVRGYTDSKGSSEANQTLSRKRAEAVRDWLVSKGGVGVQKMIVQGLGASDPVTANQNADGTDNPTGREKNRRVTVTIPQQQPPPQQAKL